MLAALFQPRASVADMAGLCRRLGTALEAGIDIRKVWQREAASRGPGGLRKALENVSQRIAKGEDVHTAICSTGDYFPTDFRELASVGEETGKLAEVFRSLAENYEHQVKLRRTFLATISWPLFQLGVSIAIIGVLIWIMGFLPKMEDGKPFDILGLGLFGTRGLLIYLLCVGLIAGVVALVIQSMRRGMAWTSPVQRVLLRIPVLGPALQTLALARLAWSMHLTLDTAMDVRKALSLALSSTRNAFYTDHISAVKNDLRQGREIHEAFAATGAFPQNFVDALAVGEQSGRLPETMEIMSDQYQDQASRALATIGMIAGFAVWAMIAMVIVFAIFQIAFRTIINPIQEQLNMMN